MFVLEQPAQQRAAGLLQSNGDFAIGEAGAQSIGPLGQGFRSLFQAGPFDGVASSGTQAQGVFFVTPIQTDEGGIAWGNREEFGFVIHDYYCAARTARARWLGFSEGLIAETSDCRHLSIRLEPKRRAGAKLWVNSSHETGSSFVIQRGVSACPSAQRQ